MVELKPWTRSPIPPSGFHNHHDKLRRSPWSPRPHMCCQLPRVTSPSLHLSSIEHQVWMHQLNLLAFTWILMAWQVEWWWIILLVALKTQEYVYDVWRVERELNWSHWGAYIDNVSNRAIGEKAVRQKVIMSVKPVLPPCYRWFNRWVYFLSFWTSRWRSTDDLFQLRRFNRWTQLVRV
jgi:hypothetical protein